MLSADTSPFTFIGLLIVLMLAGGAAGIYLANFLTRERTTYRPTPQGALMNKLKAVVCLIYVLSPIDLIPEAALGPFGLADDIVVGLVGMRAWFRKDG